MRQLARSPGLVFGLFAVSILCALASVVWRVAGAQTAVVMGVNSEAKFDHPGKDEAGAVEALALAEVALTSVAVTDLNVSGTAVRTARGAAVSGANTIPLKLALTGLPNGSYKPWARVSDAAGNWSDWSGGPAFPFDGVKPVKPGTVTVVTITVTVESTVGQ